MTDLKNHARRRCLRLAVALPVLASLAACETTGETSFGPELDGDTSLTRRVRLALEASGETANEGILVSEPDSGFIRLSGIVRSDAVSQEAERLANNVEGVNGVVNTLISD